MANGVGNAASTRSGPTCDCSGTRLPGEPTGFPRRNLAHCSSDSSCASPPGGLVVDLFAGSGTTGESAYALGRRFVLGDASPLATATARARLLRAGASIEAQDCVARRRSPTRRVWPSIVSVPACVCAWWPRSSHWLGRSAARPTPEHRSGRRGTRSESPAVAPAAYLTRRSSNPLAALLQSVSGTTTAPSARGLRRSRDPPRSSPRPRRIRGRRGANRGATSRHARSAASAPGAPAGGHVARVPGRRGTLGLRMRSGRPSS